MLTMALIIEKLCVLLLMTFYFYLTLKKNLLNRVYTVSVTNFKHFSWVLTY